MKRLIVAAEDNEADVFLIREALDIANFEHDLIVFDNGESIVEFIDGIDGDPSKTAPDLFLLDLNLPKRTGDEVFAHLRQSRRCSEAPVVIITSSDSPADRALAEKLGVSEYFLKPADLEQFLRLGEVVANLLTPPSPGASNANA